MPVPVPATANIAAAQGLELTLRDVEGEMVTPTGAAIAAALRQSGASEEVPDRKDQGISAGNKDFAHANILRAMLLTVKVVEPEKTVMTRAPCGSWRQTWTTAPAEALGYAMEVLLEAGAEMCGTHRHI